MQQSCCMLTQTACVLPGEDALVHGILLLLLTSKKKNPLAVVVPEHGLCCAWLRQLWSVHAVQTGE